jgi:hypothetical protein
MKNKVILAKGTSHLLTHMVESTNQKINVDHIVAICALRDPSLNSMNLKVDEINKNIFALTRKWKQQNQEHVLAAEYASVLLDMGRLNVKVIEGECLYVPYIYNTVKMIHKQYGCKLIEVEFFKDQLRVDDNYFSHQQTIDYLKLILS